MSQYNRGGGSKRPPRARRPDAVPRPVGAAEAAETWIEAANELVAGAVSPGHAPEHRAEPGREIEAVDPLVSTALPTEDLSLDRDAGPDVSDKEGFAEQGASAGEAITPAIESAPYLPEDPTRDHPSSVPEVLASVEPYFEPGQVAEVRVLGARDPRRPDAAPFTLAGYFDHEHRNDMVRAALKLTLHAKGVYLLLNPVDPELLATCRNRVEKYPKRTTADGDIVRRSRLLIDVDPFRISAVTGKRITAELSATDAEKARARATAEKIYQFLRGRGWPDPIAVDSGNGYQLIYRIDEPADDCGLVKRCLQALAARFDDDGAEVDRKVFNPARIVKMPGTLARKGDHSEGDRPHRRAGVVRNPEHLDVVPHELLAALADEAAPVACRAAPAEPPTPVTSGPASDTVAGRARRYLEKMPPAVQGEDGSSRAFAAACALVVGFDLAIEDAMPIMQEYSDRCSPPWSEKELLHKLEDARKKAEDEPGRAGHLLATAGTRSPSGVHGEDPFAGSAGDVPEPGRIKVDLRPVSPMPTMFVPEPFRAWLADVVRRVGCPLEYVGVAAIIAVAVLVGRRAAIRPKRHDDWTVVANLWGGVVGRPGELKTPALMEALRPLHRLVKESEEQYQEAIKAFEADAVLEKIRYEAGKKAYQNALVSNKKDDALIEDLAAKIQAPPDEAPPARRRFVINDVTVEKLLEIIRENPNGVLLFRDELIGFLRSLDHRDRQTDRAFYLEAWNGTGSFTCDRIGRGTVHAGAVCVSILGGIQPGPLAGYIRDASCNGQGDDGLIGRFQLLVYPDPPLAWVNVDKYPDAAAKDRAFEVFRKLAELDPGAVGAEVDELSGGPPFLRFSEAAQGLFDEWRADLENGKLRAEDESPLLVSHLAKYRSLMPSLALLFHLIGVVDGGECGPVSLQAAEMAAAWCDFLEEHARRIFQAGFDGDPEPARRLAARIRKGSLPNPFTARDVAEHNWSGLATQVEVDGAIAMLERLDWVRAVEIKTGGRPKIVFFINPKNPKVERGAAP